MVTFSSNDTFYIMLVEMRRSLNDKCSLDKLAEAPGSRQLDVGQGKNYHHSQEENFENFALLLAYCLNFSLLSNCSILKL